MNIEHPFAHSRIMRWGFVFSVIAVLNLFFIYSVDLLYEEPKDTLCDSGQVRIVPQTKNECEATGGKWVDDKFLQKGLPKLELLSPPPIEKTAEGYCNPDYACWQKYEDARKLYEKDSFIAGVILGTLAFLGSFFFRRRTEEIAVAFSIGGALALIVASARYWTDMPEYLRVLMLGIALVALVWVGVRKFGEAQK